MHATRWRGRSRPGPSADPRPRAGLVPEHEDELRRVERGYGDSVKPDDYLESFRTYISENRDQIEATCASVRNKEERTACSSSGSIKLAHLALLTNIIRADTVNYFDQFVPQ